MKFFHALFYSFYKGVRLDHFLRTWGNNPASCLLQVEVASDVDYINLSIPSLVPLPWLH